MESINSVAQTASKYIFGEQPAQTQTEQSSAEPVSGETGKGTVNEPYDAGNKDETVASANHPVPKETSGSTSQTLPSETPSSTNDTTPKETLGSTNNTVPKETAQPDQQKGETTAQKLESSGTGNQPTQNPKDGEKSADGPSSAHTPANKETNDKEADVLAKRDPNDHSGEPMHMHEGKENESGPKDGGEGEGEEGKSDEQKKKEAEDKGTGEKYVKSTGMAADGGDFDATKPGAGREADRLLEEKGVHKSDSSDAPSGHDSKDDAKKPSKMEKIKEKLHIGGNKHA